MFRNPNISLLYTRVIGGQEYRVSAACLTKMLRNVDIHSLILPCRRYVKTLLYRAAYRNDTRYMDFFTSTPLIITSENTECCFLSRRFFIRFSQVFWQVLTGFLKNLAKFNDKKKRFCRHFVKKNIPCLIRDFSALDCQHGRLAEYPKDLYPPYPSMLSIQSRPSSGFMTP